MRPAGPAQLSGLQRASACLKAKLPCLGYDLALAPGWPIATGMIEECCLGGAVSGQAG
jgi:hypothetical protein